MTIVNNVEEKIPPMELIKNNHLEDIISFFEGINVEAIILGCTHFPYFEKELKSITKLNIINPAEKMYEFLDRLTSSALPRIRDFNGIKADGFDGRGNYTLGIQEQIIFPEINIDSITKILGMNITFVTSAQTDEEGYALLKEFGLPFKNAKKD